MLAATEGLEAAVFERNTEDASYTEALRGTSYYDYLLAEMTVRAFLPGIRLRITVWSG